MIGIRCNTHEFEKAFGKKDLSKLHKEVITDKNGKRKTVWKKNDEATLGKKNLKISDDVTNNFTRTVGDSIDFNRNGETLSGTILAVGRDGVIVDGTESAKGVRYSVKHEDVIKVTTKVNDNDLIRYLVDKSSIKQGWRDGTDGQQPVSCNSIDGLLKAASDARDDFSNYSDSVLIQFKDLEPVLIKRPVLKGVDRIKEKLREDEKNEVLNGKTPYQFYDKRTDSYNCRTIRDTDGHTFAMNDIKDIAKMLNFFDSQQEIIRVKNNFANPSCVGYSDINMNIRLPNDTIAEIQLNTTANIVAKERYGHALYEVFRTIGNNEKYSELKNVMEAAQKSLYGLSNELSKNGRFPRLKGNEVYSVTYKPYADAIKEHVQQAIPLFRKAEKEGVFNEKTIKNFNKFVERIKE